MSSRHPDFSLLYALLRSQTQPDIPQTKEKEKDILILLSQVSLSLRISLICHAPKLVSAMDLEGHRFLANVASVLGSELEEFLNLLWASLEAAILNIYSSSSVSSPAGLIIPPDARYHFKHNMNEVAWTTQLDCSLANTISDLQKRLLNANWLTVTCLVQVLRNILKSLKQDYVEFLGAYLHSFGSFPSTLWDLLHEIFVGQNDSLQMCSNEILPIENNCAPQSKYLFLGALLQLFCSMVDQNVLEEAPERPFDELPFLAKIIKLVPLLSRWCFTEHADHEGNQISRYLRHKILLYMDELHYDHLVLLDYLISKDTGVHGAQYLLRPLMEMHMVLDSDGTFIM
ncbi:hypothetical protein ACLOJK_038696 [Asimina triloba]